MKAVIARLCNAGLLLAALASAPLVLAEGAYLFDVLDDPRYLKAWNAMIASRDDVDAWLREYGESRNGPSAPATTVTVGGATYEVGFVCKAHDCGDNQFYVIFAADGSTASGLLLKNGVSTYFGNPDPATVRAFEKALDKQ